MDYFSFEVEFKEIDPWRDIAVSEMADCGFESFIETKTGVIGYIQADNRADNLRGTISSLDGVHKVTVVKIKAENWNKKWEENFDPIFIEDKLAIVAPFHDQKNEYELVVTIQPQMSFGTGHHPTTWLMANHLLNLDLSGKSVLDMGTGTGVLAIIAEKRSAAKITAIDIDDWSYENAKENCKLNACSQISVHHGGHELLGDFSFDLIIANINKNVLLENFSVYSKCLNRGGFLLLSGFFTTDNDDLIEQARNSGFVFESESENDEWSMLKLKKT